MAVTIGPFTLTRAQLVPVKYKSRTYLSTAVAGDGSVAVSGSAIVERLYSIHCKLPLSEAQQLISYIENSLRFRAETCVVIDGYGVTRMMRYWDDNIDTSTLGGNIVELDLPFREEVAG